MTAKGSTTRAKRTICGIVFFHDREKRVWKSEEGVLLYCASALRKNLSDHWWIEYGGRSWCSGMTAADAVAGFLRSTGLVVAASIKNPDYTKLTWGEMAEVVRAVWREMKRRNPIGINMYEGSMFRAFSAVSEIARAEKSNPTCEAGPGVDDGK